MFRVPRQAALLVQKASDSREAWVVRPSLANNEVEADDPWVESMSFNADTNLRQNARYQITDETGVTVTPHDADESREACKGLLLDLSVGGAKVQTPRALPPGTMITITINVEVLQQTMTLVGEVRWGKPVSGTTWCLGCAFEESVSPQILQKLAETGLLERRQSPRVPVTLNASARCELDLEKTPVSVLDHSSQGGFRLLVPLRRLTGRRVELLIQEGDQTTVVRGRMCWASSSKLGQHVGCEFVSPMDATRFAAVLNRGQNMDPSSQKASGSLQPSHRDRPSDFGEFVTKCVTLSVAIIGVSAMLVSLYLEPPQSVSGNPDDLCLFASQADSWTETNLTPNDSQNRATGSHVSIPLDWRQFMQDELDLTAISTWIISGNHSEVAALPSVSPYKSQQTEPEPASTPENSSQSRVVSAVPHKTIEPQPPESASVDEFGRMTEQPGPETTAPVVVDLQPVSIAAVNENPAQAVAHYHAARSYYHKGHFRQAASALEMAVQLDPAEPTFLYMLALAHYQLQEPQLAMFAVTQAAKLEGPTPKNDWGRVMEGFQGPARFWLENTRRAARSELFNTDVP